MSQTANLSVAPARRRRWTWRQFAAAVAVVVVLTAGAALVIDYLEERPLRQASSALAENKPRDALRFVEKYLAEHPHSEKALALKARSLVGIKRYNEAIRLFQRVKAADFEELHDWATAYLHQQQWSAALPLLEGALQVRPRDPDVLHEITACRSFVGLTDRALESAALLSQIPGQEARAFVQLATLHDQLGNPHKAAEAWERVHQFAPEGENLQVPPQDFFLAYGRSLLADGRPQEALPFLKQSVARKQTADGHYHLGRALADLGRKQDAFAEWTHAVERSTAHREAREALADAALGRGEATGALEWLAPLAERSDLRSTTAYLFQRAHARLGDKDAAGRWQERTVALRKAEKFRAALDHAVTHTPQSFWARVIRTHRFAADGNWPEASALAEVLLRDAPNDPFVRDLAQAIRTRSPLPDLARVPVVEH